MQISATRVVCKTDARRYLCQFCFPRRRPPTDLHLCGVGIIASSHSPRRSHGKIIIFVPFSPFSRQCPVRCSNNGFTRASPSHPNQKINPYRQKQNARPRVGPRVSPERHYLHARLVIGSRIQSKETSLLARSSLV